MIQAEQNTITSSDELDSLYAINQVATRYDDWKAALDQIAQLIRAILIFDNLVLYLPDVLNGVMEAAYARSVGRGKTSGADLSWGETVANQVLADRQVIMQQPSTTQGGPAENRLEKPYVLGVPLQFKDKIFGILVLIRYGGPVFDQRSIRLAVFIGAEIAHLVERKNLKNNLENLQREQQQAKIQDDFISTISHELLTPLGFIKGYATTLLRSDTNWDEKLKREFLTIIDQETDRLQELIDNILDSTRLQSGSLPMEFQPVRLDVLVRDVILRAQMQHLGLQVQIHSNSESNIPIHGDPRRLAQVIDNLLENAIKYAPNSIITVTIRHQNDEMLIIFQDTGPGIPAQYLPRLFERFFRNPEQPGNVRGTGLGLYICKQIIKAHDGTIAIDSTVGVGTVVSIRLPCPQNTRSLNDTMAKIEKEELDDANPCS
jgi:K+-sensing histidine kinase KdpD